MIIGIGGVALTKSKGGAAFDPKVLSGLQLWLKADTGVLDASDNPITVDSTAIKTWQDQSGIIDMPHRLRQVLAQFGVQVLTD
jgi:hypothetical protein